MSEFGKKTFFSLVSNWRVFSFFHKNIFLPLVLMVVAIVVRIVFCRVLFRRWPNTLIPQWFGLMQQENIFVEYLVCRSSKPIWNFDLVQGNFRKTHIYTQILIVFFSSLLSARLLASVVLVYIYVCVSVLCVRERKRVCVLCLALLWVATIAVAEFFVIDIRVQYHYFPSIAFNT